MTDTKFTPGPWRVANNGRKGKKTPTFRIWRNDPNQPDGDNFRNTGYASISSHVSGESNAHLIAAAPELYAALEWYEARLGNVRKITPEGEKSRNELDRDFGDRARAALAKARGEA